MTIGQRNYVLSPGWVPEKLTTPFLAASRRLALILRASEPRLSRKPKGMKKGPEAGPCFFAQFLENDQFASCAGPPNSVGSVAVIVPVALDAVINRPDASKGGRHLTCYTLLTRGRPAFRPQCRPDPLRSGGVHDLGHPRF